MAASFTWVSIYTLYLTLSQKFGIIKSCQKTVNSNTAPYLLVHVGEELIITQF